MTTRIVENFHFVIFFFRSLFLCILVLHSYIYTLHNTHSPIFYSACYHWRVSLIFILPCFFSWFIAFQVVATVVIQIEKKVFHIFWKKLKHIFVLFFTSFCWRKRWILKWKERKSSSQVHTHISSHTSHMTKLWKFFTFI
jgi:hypothetical protein